LKPGDEITTIGGIMGKVVDVSKDAVTFETSEDRVRVKVAKWAISTVGTETEQTK
jgi:preprotein translocase subunit YajC